MFEAMWCLTNVASGSTSDSKHLMDIGVMEMLGNYILPTLALIEQDIENK